MDSEILEDLGLVKTEIKTYIALLELGPSTAGPILEKSGLPNSTLHRDLNALINKGLVNFIKSGKRNIYQATDPEQLLAFIDERKKRVEMILPELKQKQSLATPQETATIYKGLRGIKEAYNIMINTEGKEYLTFGGGPPCAELMGLHWWLNLHERRTANKLHSRQIFDTSVKHIGGTEIQKKKLTNIRYLPADFAQFQETVIVGDTVAVNVFTDSPYAFVVKDQQVADGYKKYFEILWAKAKQ